MKASGGACAGIARVRRFEWLQGVVTLACGPPGGSFRRTRVPVELCVHGGGEGAPPSD